MMMTNYNDKKANSSLQLQVVQLERQHRLDLAATQTATAWRATSVQSLRLMQLEESYDKQLAAAREQVGARVCGCVCVWM